jgi:galactokinase
MTTLVDKLTREGMAPGAAGCKAQLFERAVAALGLGGRDDASHLAVFVPGRIEVLGKHTDYAGGRSLLCAAERGFCLVARLRSDSRVSMTDVVDGSTAQVALEETVQPPDGGWALYVATVARRLARNFPQARRGADIAFGSDLPPAAGMSSSSALVTSVMLVLSDINDLPAADAYRHDIGSREDLAEYLGTIENGQDFRGLLGDAGVGTFGGSEDHTAMLCCRAGELSQYAFCPVRHERQVPMPAGCQFVVGVSGVVAAKAGSARETYNRAALSARQLLASWTARTGRQERTLAAAVEKWGREDFAFLRASEDLPEGAALADRFDQFFDETFTIIPAVADALAAGRIARIGDLVDRSQQGAERGLGNQVPETVYLAASARRFGALAASAFGAGFGGSVWALVGDGDVARFIDGWRSSYNGQFPHRAARAQFFATHAGPAAMRVR